MYIYIYIYTFIYIYTYTYTNIPTIRTIYPYMGPGLAEATLLLEQQHLIPKLPGNFGFL